MEATTIAKEPRIEVFNPYSRSRYYTDLTSARALIADRSGKWEGRRVILNDKSKVTWAPKQSGIDGPLVMQVVA